MPGPRPCEVGCTCSKHPQGMLSRAEMRARRADAARARRASDPEHYRDIDHRSAAKNREKRRARDRAVGKEKRLRMTHGMTLDDWAAMADAQVSRCCYCERPLPEDAKQVHVDHDHSCTCGPKQSCRFCRRGLACQNCNFVVGNAGDDPDRLEVIAANLRRLKTDAAARINRKPVQAELPINVVRLAGRKKESA